MSIIKKYPPQSAKDLIFADPKVAAEIEYYATGQKTEHLLLYGPPGSGKSIAAQVIVDSCLPGLKGGSFTAPIQACSPFTNEFAKIDGNRNWQFQNGAKQAYVIIDEVDQLSDKERMALRNIIDNEWTAPTTLICTTNHLHKLEDPFIDRFNSLKVDPPTNVQWQPLVQKILQAEGFASSVPTSNMAGKIGPMSARDVSRMIDDMLLGHKAAQKKTVASIPPTPVP